MESVTFQSASPIGETNVNALPVKDIGPAIGYYVHILGFTVVEKDEKSAALRRDEATIGLAQNGDDPEQSSVYFSVSDAAQLRQELTDKGIEPSELRTDEYGGKRYRVFFAKEPYGVCFCFGQPE